MLLELVTFPGCPKGIAPFCTLPLLCLVVVVVVVVLLLLQKPSANEAWLDDAAGAGAGADDAGGVCAGATRACLQNCGPAPTQQRLPPSVAPNKLLMPTEWL